MAGYAPVAPHQFAQDLDEHFRSIAKADLRLGVDLADYRFRITPGAGEVLHDDVDSSQVQAQRMGRVCGQFTIIRVGRLDRENGIVTTGGDVAFPAQGDKTPGFGHAFSTQPELLKQVDSLLIQVKSMLCLTAERANMFRRRLDPGHQRGNAATTIPSHPARLAMHDLYDLAMGHGKTEVFTVIMLFHHGGGVESRRLVVGPADRRFRTQPGEDAPPLFLARRLDYYRVANLPGSGNCLLLTLDDDMERDRHTELTEDLGGQQLVPSHARTDGRCRIGDAAKQPASKTSLADKV